METTTTNDTQRLAEQIQKALEGEAWHGPSWREVLEGVSREAALTRPIPRAHTIAEIVAHATTWHDVVRRRLNGETPQVTDAEDWPDPAAANDDAWAKAVSRLMETGHALRKTVEAFPAARIHEPRPGLDQTWHTLIIGELQHMLYHAGQVAILWKASVKS